jgi:hypothetical protein
MLLVCTVMCNRLSQDWDQRNVCIITLKSAKRRGIPGLRNRLATSQKVDCSIGVRSQFCGRVNLFVQEIAIDVSH